MRAEDGPVLLIPLLIPLALAEPTPRAPAGWTALSAEWTVSIRPDEPVRLTARYTLASVDADADQLTLVGPELLVTDAPGPVVATPGGLGVALNPDRTRIEQRVEGLYVPDTAGSLSLGILLAARTHVTVDAPGLDVTIPGAVQGWLAPTDRLSVTWVPHVEGEPTHVRAVVQGESATTFRGDAGAIAVDSVLRWKVLRGEVERFTFDAAGLEELDVAGPNILSWERLGQTVTVRTSAPVKGLYVVTVRGRAAPGKGERAAPTPIPTGVNRVDRYVTMARSDEGELIPLSAPASVALGSLPEWARNLGEAAPLAAWHGAEGVRVIVATADVLSGPGTVVTAARYTLAASRDGRAALRMNLRVRNERRQYLHLVPPPTGTVAGAMRWRPIVIRVANQPKSWLSDGQGGIYVPLERSVETLRGPLSFPVDIEWIGDGAPWNARGEQSLQLPSIDAPVQAATWEVHLPRGYARVGAPKGGGTEGFVLTDLRAEDLAAERKKEEVVSSAVQNAVSAYRKNDFSGAARWLEEAKNADEDNEEVAQLQSNLDVFSGKSGNTNDLNARRIRDLAKARNDELADEQQVLEKEAEELLRAGDLDAAESRYGQALDVANKLQQTEQLESVEQKSKIEVAQNKLAEIADKKTTRDTVSMGKLGSYGKKGVKSAEVSIEFEDTDGDAIADEVDGRVYAGDAADDSGVAPEAFGYTGDEEVYEEEMSKGEAYKEVLAEKASAMREQTRAATSTGTVTVGGGRGSGRGSGSGSSGVRSEPKPPMTVPTPAPPVVYAVPASSAPAPAYAASPSPEPQAASEGDWDRPAQESVRTKDAVAESRDGHEGIEVQAILGLMGSTAGPMGGEGSGEDEPARSELVAEDLIVIPSGRRPRVIERREPLDASPSPMALAMPLDGPAVTTRQALLPGDTFPTWRLQYRRLPGEPE